MKMLIVNAGSSSIKFTVFDVAWFGKERVLATGQVECIGLPTARLKYKRCGEHALEQTIELVESKDAPPIDHETSLKKICDKLLDQQDGVIENIDQVKAIGHRVVHGGEKITKPVIVDDSVKQTIKDCFSLAPLHNPANLTGIEACERIFKGVPNVAIFDTAFHQSMPPESYLYAIPYELYQKHGIRKYGFHGTSHHYVAQATANFLKIPLDELKLITCHLGNGCSMAAINKGKVLDTSMGMTPLEGLVMGTRCGDLDPAVVIQLMKLGNSVDEVDKILNKESGLLGVAGIGSGDMRDVIDASKEGNERAKTALDMFVGRIVKYIGAYYTALNCADAIVFTGGIGEYAVPLREKILSKLAGIGIFLDSNANSNCHGTAAFISTPNSKVKAIVMPTNEELMIARQSIEVLLSKNRLKLVTV